MPAHIYILYIYIHKFCILWAGTGPVEATLYRLPPLGRHWADDQNGTGPVAAASRGPILLSPLGQYKPNADMLRGIHDLKDFFTELLRKFSIICKVWFPDFVFSQ